MPRALIHYWRSSLAVVLACAVATAVLTGALMVGDSVEGSLRQLTEERLGGIDFALVTPMFFRRDLARELDAETGRRATPSAAALLVPGSAVHATSRARASGVGIQGVDESFLAFFPDQTLDLARREGQRFASVVVNDALRRELGAEIGDEILLALERPGEAPRGTLLGSTDTGDVVRQLRLELVAALPDRGAGRFSLRPSQELPFVAFVDLGELAEALERDGLANALLVAGSEDRGPAEERDALQAALRRVVELEDLGLEAEAGTGWVELRSRDYVVSPALRDAVVGFAARADAVAMPISTYIANRLELGRRSTPYSSVTALDLDDEAFGGLRLENGERGGALRDDEVYVNRWLAEDLEAETGDELLMTYFEVGPKEDLTTRSASFRVRGIVEIEELAADRGLTPEYPGIHDSDNMSDWDPPFPVDLGLVRDKDEDYWDEYRGTPKAFFSFDTGSRLWGTRFGDVTSVRLAPSAGGSVEELHTDVVRNLAGSAAPDDLGLSFEAVKARGLEASGGAVDFRMLFVSFSVFLIASAALLVALFFGLGVEQRASEIGLLLAVGIPQRQVRRRFLVEGALLSLVGVAVGLVGAVGYAALMMAALRTWWRAAVGTPYLFLHVEPTTLLLGAVISFGVAVLSVTGALRRLRKVPALSLLRGVTDTGPASLHEKRVLWTFRIAGGGGLATLVAALATGQSSSPVFFFVVGGCLLVAGLAWIALRFARPGGELRPGRASLVPMAARNAALNPGRSLLAACLVASAAFVIVAASANGFRYREGVRELDSPAGGYTLMAESDIPLHADLEDPDVLFDLGIPDREAAALAGTRVTGFRSLPGDDVSCLNLYQPERPRILGVPPGQRARGGFRFQQLLFETDDPWSLLTADLDGAVPAFADHESALWILKVGLGEDIVLDNERGGEVRLRLVGLLEKGLFQSEVLIAEESFKEHFPSESGYSFFLIDPPEGTAVEAGGILESRLGAYGFDLTTTAERLQRFQAVFNTYIATFQTLGGLGLLLGTLGLAAILLRNVAERRGELATLRALGFRRGSLGWLVVVENALLLVCGVGIGAVSALVAVAPHLLAGSALVPWGSLVLTLLGILVVGMLACAAAVRGALAAPLLPALKAE